MYLVIDPDETDAREIPLLDPRDALMRELLADAVETLGPVNVLEMLTGSPASAGARIRVKEVD